MRIDYDSGYRKKKYLFLLLLLILPTDYIYNQNVNLDSALYYSPDSLKLNFSFNKIDLIGFNLSLANKLANLDLIYGDINFNTESYSNYYKNIYGISPLQKD